MNPLGSVSPFTNVFPLELFSGFVGRREELEAIHAKLSAGARGLVILGHAGIGKTALARMFAKRAEKDYPGGIFSTSASWAESPDHLLDRTLTQAMNGRALLVVDDAEAFD
jgi:MoxR-like ATPase